MQATASTEDLEKLFEGGDLVGASPSAGQEKDRLHPQGNLPKRPEAALGADPSTCSSRVTAYKYSTNRPQLQEKNAPDVLTALVIQHLVIQNIFIRVIGRIAIFEVVIFLEVYFSFFDAHKIMSGTVQAKIQK